MARKKIITEKYKLVVIDICDKLPRFNFIDLNRVFFFGRKGKKTKSGNYAICHPTKFRNGKRRLGIFCKQLVRINNVYMKYLISFCFPRFIHLDCREKVKVFIHELLHIDPSFNGRINQGLSHSRKFRKIEDELTDSYLQVMGKKVKKILSLKPKHISFHNLKIKDFEFENYKAKRVLTEDDLELNELVL